MISTEKKIIEFKRDTRFRQNIFTSDSFAHPAKLDAQLLIWIVEKFTNPGNIILDPMFGSGTLELACLFNRNVIGIELENKYIRMSIHNWDKVKLRPQLGYPLGNCDILWGDARQLNKIQVHPYQELWRKYLKYDIPQIKSLRRHYILPLLKTYHGNIPCDSIISSPPYAEVANAKKNTGSNLSKEERIALNGKREGNTEDGMRYSLSNNNIGNLPYGQIDSIISSPPYEAIVNPNGEGPGMAGNEKQRLQIYAGNKKEIAASSRNLGYSENSNNIGNLKSDSYLQAMLQVYTQCYSVLKPQGLMILITKNFIRNKQVVRLDSDTIKLCEQAGFTFEDRYYRKLPAQSFWRTLYTKKYPDVPLIEFEDVLIFKKQELLSA